MLGSESRAAICIEPENDPLFGLAPLTDLVEFLSVDPQETNNDSFPYPIGGFQGMREDFRGSTDISLGSSCPFIPYNGVDVLLAGFMGSGQVIAGKTVFMELLGTGTGLQTSFPLLQAPSVDVVDVTVDGELENRYSVPLLDRAYCMNELSLATQPEGIPGYLSVVVEAGSEPVNSSFSLTGIDEEGEEISDVLNFNLASLETGIQNTSKRFASVDAKGISCGGANDCRISVYQKPKYTVDTYSISFSFPPPDGSKIRSSYVVSDPDLYTHVLFPSQNGKTISVAAEETGRVVRYNRCHYEGFSVNLEPDSALTADVSFQAKTKTYETSLPTLPALEELKGLSISSAYIVMGSEEYPDMETLQVNMLRGINRVPDVSDQPILNYTTFSVDAECTQTLDSTDISGLYENREKFFFALVVDLSDGRSVMFQFPRTYVQIYASPIDGSSHVELTYTLSMLYNGAFADKMKVLMVSKKLNIL